MVFFPENHWLKNVNFFLYIFQTEHAALNLHLYPNYDYRKGTIFFWNNHILQDVVFYCQCLNEAVLEFSTINSPSLNILFSSTWSIWQEIHTIWMKDIPEPEACMKRKPAIVVLIVDENSVPNLYIRLTFMRPFFSLYRGKNDQTTTSKIAKKVYKEKL